MADLVVVDYHALKVHAHVQDRREVLDAVEGDLGDVQQSRHATDLHERSVGLDGLDVAVSARGGIRGVGYSSILCPRGKYHRVVCQVPKGLS